MDMIMDIAIRHHLFVVEPGSLEFKLLPIAENQFMNPSREYYLEFLIEKDQILGFNTILRDGRQFYVEKTTEQVFVN